MNSYIRSIRFAVVCFGVVTPVAAVQQRSSMDCAYHPPGYWVSEYRAAIARGEVAPTALARVAPVERRNLYTVGAAAPACIAREQIHAFEDTNQVLLTNFSTGELLALMTAGANDLIATHGDVFDFIGFWVNSTPDHEIGAAFYMPIFNEISGIGDPSTSGTPIFDERANMGLNTSTVDGYVMMWEIDHGYWQPGTDTSADFVRLVLGQEFEHRWAMFLPDLLDGRTMQGDNSSCGRTFHWNFKVDGQGSGMEISEWVGSSPAVPTGLFVSFNTDIPGSVFSYTDLYLMGYVSPQEMDAGNSELRFMEMSDCSSNYNGLITDFDSSDIIASAGARVPDAASSQVNYRTGWVMIHQPNDAPTNAQLDKAVGILEQHQVDWSNSTLGRGTMNNTLFDDCNCNGVADADDLLLDIDFNNNGALDECEAIGSGYCNANVNSTGQAASIYALGSDVAADNDLELVARDLPLNKLGYFIVSQTQGFVPLAGGSQGNLCILGAIGRFNAQAQNSGVDGFIGIAVNLTSIPQLGPVLAGQTFNFQSWYRDNNPGSTSNFSDAVEIAFL